MKKGIKTMIRESRVLDTIATTTKSSMMLLLKATVLALILATCEILPISCTVDASSHHDDNPSITVATRRRILYVDNFEPNISNDGESTTATDNNSTSSSSSLKALNNNSWIMNGSYTMGSGVVHDEKYCKGNDAYYCFKLTSYSHKADEHHSLTVASVERSIDLSNLMVLSNYYDTSKQQLLLSSPSAAKILFDYHVIDDIFEDKARAKNNNNAAKVHTSKDNGITWTKVATLPVGSTGTMELDVEIEKDTPSSLFKIKFMTHHGTTLYVDNVIVEDTTIIPVTKLDGTISHITESNSISKNDNDMFYHWTDHWSSGPGVRIGIDATKSHHVATKNESGSSLLSSCANGNCLRLVLTDGVQHTVKSERSANLKGAKTATLKFNIYQTLFSRTSSNSKTTTSGNIRGSVWVKNGNDKKDTITDDNDSDWTMIDSLHMDRASLSNNNEVRHQSIDIPSKFLTEHFKIKFSTEGHEWNDIFIYDIQIDINNTIATVATADEEQTLLPQAPIPAPKTGNNSSPRLRATGNDQSSAFAQHRDSQKQERRSLVTSENFADDFDGDSTAFTGNDGSLNWSDNNWSPSVSGYYGMYLTTMSGWCLSGKCLRLLANKNFITQEYSDRGANLSGGVTSATLTFHSRAYLHSSGNAKVLISSNGGATYQTLKVLGTSAKTHTLTIPSSYYTSNFRLRFYVDGYDWNDLYIDNISLDITISNTSPVAAPVAAPVPSATVIDNNYADDFDVNTGFTGNDGSLDWSDASWTGSGSGTGVYVMPMSYWCASQKCLRLLANKSYYRVVTSDRGADLSTASSASITFYSKAALDGHDGIARAYISKDGGQTYDLLVNIQDRNPQTTTYTLSSQYFTSQFRIRFYVAGTSWNDLYIDDISLDINSPSTTPIAPTPTAPTPTVPTPIAPTPTPPTPTAPTPTGGTFSPGCGSMNNGIVPGSHGFVTINSSNKNRQYYLSIPQNYNSNTNYDLIFGFHGVGWRGDWMADYLKLNITETYGDNAIFVYPSALNRYWPMWTFEKYNSNWVEGWLTGQLQTNEDFIFFDDMLSDISNDLCINPKRVYVTGQSWGGDMASALPCARGNQIAASVSVASNAPVFFDGYYNHYNLFPPLGSASNCDRPVPMITLKGQYDPIVSGTGKVADWWYKINECTTAVGSTLKDTINILGKYEDVGCAQPNIFIQYSNSYTGLTDHQTPRKYPHLYNETTMNFFNQHTLP